MCGLSPARCTSLGIGTTLPGLLYCPDDQTCPSLCPADRALGKLGRLIESFRFGQQQNDTKDRSGGIISFSIKEMDPDLLVSQMSKWGINISTTSSVSTPYDMQQRNIQLMNRLGIHYYNTESEIDHFLECLQKMGK